MKMKTKHTKIYGMQEVIDKGYKISFGGKETDLKLWWWLNRSMNMIKILNDTLKMDELYICKL
jgi:hypothetical protein